MLILELARYENNQHVNIVRFFYDRVVVYRWGLLCSVPCLLSVYMDNRYSDNRFFVATGSYAGICVYFCLCDFVSWIGIIRPLLDWTWLDSLKIV